MNISRGHSVAKLQKQIHKELYHLQNRRPQSLTSLPSQDSLRSSISKSVKSIFLDQSHVVRKNKSFKALSPSSKCSLKQTKLGRSQDVAGLKKMKNTIGKLKKKKSDGLTKQFTTMSRKNYEPTQAGSLFSISNSVKQDQFLRLLQKNKHYQEKIKSQNILIQKLEGIIEELGN